MVSLPTSIEAYLTESGFTSTELLILKHLLEGHAVTLRELGSKTGKSSGVLDQAMKKLLKRKIVVRQMVNDTPKFMLFSPDAILEWVKRDTEDKHKVLHRKEKDFQSFIDSLRVDGTRPKMEYFEGDDGLQKAYRALLDCADGEMLSYVPIDHKEEDDPLRDFRVQYFRERRKRGVFSRVLAPDTAMGRRYQSRDVFEYRQTQLLPEDQYPLGFEKIITRDTVACFNHAQKQACFMKYQDLAASEQRMFDLLWNRQPVVATEVPSSETELRKRPPEVPLETRTISAVREFFLSRKSIAALALCAVLAVSSTFLLYRYTLQINTERIRDQVRAITATAAEDFEIRDLLQLQHEEDISKPEWTKVVMQLRGIREQNPELKYVYILRPTVDPDLFEFVADADSLDPYAQIDLNNDGVIDDADALNPPGDPYDVTGVYSFHQGLIEPAADEEPYSDQWGTFISGAAPIKDETGQTVAILSVDRKADDIKKLALETFQPTVFFFILFLIFIAIRLAAFHRSLLKELSNVLLKRNVIIWISILALISFAMTAFLYRQNYYLNLQRIRERVESIAATGAPRFDAHDVNQLHTLDDTRKPEYAKVIGILNEIRESNPDVVYAYIMRPTKDKYFYEFVADADSLLLNLKQDLNGDGLLNDVVAPGQLWFNSEGEKSSLVHAWNEASSDSYPLSDPWGTWISSGAPIKNIDGNTVAILGVDIEAEKITELSKETFSPLLFFFAIFVSYVFFKFLTYNSALLSDFVSKT